MEKKTIYDVAAVIRAARDDFDSRGHGSTYVALANTLLQVDTTGAVAAIFEVEDTASKRDAAAPTTVFVDLAVPANLIDVGCDSCGATAVNIVSSAVESASSRVVTPNAKMELLDDPDGEVINSEARSLEEAPTGDSEQADRTVAEPTVDAGATALQVTQEVVFSDAIKSAEKIAYQEKPTKEGIKTPAELLARFGGDETVLKSWALKQGMSVKFLKGDALVRKVYELLP